MTGLAQGEQGRVGRQPRRASAAAGLAARRRLLRLADRRALPDRRRPRCGGHGGAGGLRRRHAGHVRHQRRLSPAAWSAAGVAAHATGRPQRDLRRHRRDVARRWPGWLARVGRGAASSAWSGPAPRAGIALRQVFLDAPQWVVAIPYVVVGWCPIIVAPQLVRSLGWAGFALMLVAGLFYTAGAWSTPASDPTRGRGSSASTRCSTPARWWARGCSPTSSRSLRCRVTEHRLKPCTRGARPCEPRTAAPPTGTRPRRAQSRP